MSRQSLAVDFFLIAHDPFRGGRLRTSPELLGCGLVGAELADLIIARRLAVDGKHLVVVEPAGQPDDLHDYVIETVGSQDSAHTVRSWVEPLQDGLYALIGRELVSSGTVRRQAGARRLARGGRQPDRFPTDDLLTASRPRQGLERLLRKPKDLTLAYGTLAALIESVGLDGLLDPDLDRAVLRVLLTEIEQNLPPDLQILCAGVRSVAADVSLRAR